MKTIRMPKELLEKWLVSLRTSTLDGAPITQAQELLSDGRGGFCCLGVLQMVAAGATEAAEGVELLSIDWQNRHGVQMFSERGNQDDAPHLPTLGVRASVANDAGRSFAEIADAIEACAEGV